jgi:DNA invertase Pin-like site-specific DNA recombinase
MVRTEALSYLRVSSPGQVAGDGIERQRLAVATYAKSEGYQIVEEYRDDGVSGTCEWEGRPGLSAMLERLASNGVRVVIVERADRLARDMMVSELILAECRRLDVLVLDASGNDLASDEDPTRVLFRQMMIAVAQFDKCSIVRRMRAARDRIAKRTGRRPEGRKAYGHYPGEVAVLARARALLASHVAGKRPHYAAVARELNAEGLATRTGVPWSAAMVRRVLTR